MRYIIVRSLRENEKRRFLEFMRNLPERDFWGKKSRMLKKDLVGLEEFFGYIKQFQSRRFFVAEENSRLVGFIAAVYNPEWISELTERYGRTVDKRAHILGMAVVKRKPDVLKALTGGLADYFSKKGIEYAEYPTMGNVCLTTATDVLTPENVDALTVFRDVGFKISDCYYSMTLDLESYKNHRGHLPKKAAFRFKERTIEMLQENEVLGRMTWDPAENKKTNIGICVGRNHRGKGLGTALMTEALHRLKAQGTRTVELGVDGNNLPAVKLYRKLGFEVERTHLYVILPCKRQPPVRIT